MFRQRMPLSSIAAASLMLTIGCSQAENPDQPAVMRALEAQGLTSIQEFKVEGGLRAFAGVAGGSPIAVYVSADGNAIVGTRLNAKGEPLDESTLQNLVAKPMAEQTWAQLESATWVLDGRADAPRIVYTFSDPNCPYCNRFWKAARPWVDAGKVQLRHLLVGIIKQNSPAKAAAILGAPDPTAALLENEHNYANGGIAPAQTVPAEIRSALEANQVLMASLGLRGTPGIIVQDGKGLLKQYNGMPRPEMLAEVLGPR